MRARRDAALALLLLVASSTRAAPPADPDAAARATMQRVFGAMTVLLPASAKAGGFSDPAQRENLRRAFAELSAAASDLRAHGRARDASFRLHARNLADDARLASSAFALGDEEEARFTFTLLTQRCADCHSRLPDADDSPLAARLAALPEVEALAPLERARVDVALRRFDEALAIWERAFANPAEPPAQHELGGALADYLTIAIRVKGDARRPQQVLRSMAARDDTPGYLRTRLIAWGISLARVAPKLAQSTSSLQTAREWGMMARNLSDLPTARDGLVYDLAASSVLLRWIDARVTGAAQGAQDLELATAYYELAVIEDRTAFSIWAPQTDAYMEAAIRAAPSGPHARRAYARVEEQLLTELGATGPEGLPEQERARLAQLRELIARAQPGAAGKP
jgi:tetratricopeptide (TPR) repeat protein